MAGGAVGGKLVVAQVDETKEIVGAVTYVGPGKEILGE
jgi:hypothetical protein